MPHFFCPTCQNKLRIPGSQRSFSCIKCNTKINYGPQGELSYIPNLSWKQKLAQKPVVQLELKIILLGFICLVALIALQKFVLSPYGAAHPMVEVTVIQGQATANGTFIPYKLESTYNGILYWGSIISYGSVSFILWLTFLVVKYRRRKAEWDRLKPPPSEADLNMPVAAVADKESGTVPVVAPSTPAKVSSGRVRRRSRNRAIYGEKTIFWVLWGGGTAAGILLLGGALVPTITKMLVGR